MSLSVVELLTYESILVNKFCAFFPELQQLLRPQKTVKVRVSRIKAIFMFIIGISIKYIYYYYYYRNITYKIISGMLKMMC